MKYEVFFLLLFLISILTSCATKVGLLDGKGLICSKKDGLVGYWFSSSRVKKIFIDKNIYLGRYSSPTPSIILWKETGILTDDLILDRQTLSLYRPWGNDKIREGGCLGDIYYDQDDLKENLKLRYQNYEKNNKI